MTSVNILGVPASSEYRCDGHRYHEASGRLSACDTEATFDTPADAKAAGWLVKPEHGTVCPHYRHRLGFGDREWPEPPTCCRHVHRTRCDDCRLCDYPRTDHALHAPYPHKFDACGCTKKKKAA